MSTAPKVALCAVVRNEADIITEWIAYHLGVGFDIIVLYDNGSSDGTVELIEAAGRFFDVRLVKWNDRSANFQLQAYADAVSRLRSTAEWIAFWDTDEFLVIDNYDDVKGFLGDFPEAAAVAVPERFFGSSGLLQSASNLLTRSYVRRAGDRFFPNRHVKSFVRPESVISTETPHSFRVAGPYLGVDKAEVKWEISGLLLEQPNGPKVRLNHYFTRSREDWLKKMARGHPDGTIRGDADFITYDMNKIYDVSALRFAHRTDAIIKQLSATLDTASRARVRLILIVPENGSASFLDRLRELYSGRFSNVSLVGRELDGHARSQPVRSSDSGSVQIIDAAHIAEALADSDCSDFLFVDARRVLLAPSCDESNVHDSLGINPGDAYLPSVTAAEWPATSDRSWFCSDNGVDLGIGSPILPSKSNALMALRPFIPIQLSAPSTKDSFVISSEVSEEDMIVDASAQNSLPLARTEFGGIAFMPRHDLSNVARVCGALKAAGVAEDAAFVTAMVLECSRVRVSPDPSAEFLRASGVEGVAALQRDPHLLAVTGDQQVILQDHIEELMVLRDFERPPPRVRREGDFGFLQLAVMAIAPNFDPTAYLLANPDVAAAGAAPFSHFFHFGRAEGRRLKPG